MRAKLTIFWFLSVFGVIANGTVTKLPRDEKERILTNQFAEVNRIRQVPSHVRRGFARLIGDTRFRMAEPGGKYQETDEANGPILPERRLVFAAIGGNYHILHYERGGRGHGYYVVVFRNSGKEAVFVWGGVSDRRLKNTDDVLNSIRRNSLTDELQFSW